MAATLLSVMRLLYQALLAVATIPGDRHAAIGSGKDVRPTTAHRPENRPG